MKLLFLWGVPARPVVLTCFRRLGCTKEREVLVFVLLRRIEDESRRLNKRQPTSVVAKRRKRTTSLCGTDGYPRLKVELRVQTSRYERLLSKKNRMTSVGFEPTPEDNGLNVAP